MSQIQKHAFEAISLLTAESGMIEMTMIPAMNQPDWIVPSSLILSVDDYDERVWSYGWQQQEVAVFHLLPRDQAVDKVIVLEGNTVAHRLALQTKGELKSRKVRISEVKDTELPERYLHNDAINSKQTKAALVNSDTDDNDRVEDQFKEDDVMSYLFQTVVIDNEIYLVPDLDKIAHQLVDLDS